MISKICFHDVTLPSVYSAHPKHQAQGTTSTGQGLRNVYPAETPCPWYNWRSFPESSALGTPARWASGAAPGPSWSSSWCWCWYPAGFQGPRKRRSGASCINMYTVYSHLYYIICEHAANYNKWSFIYIYISDIQKPYGHSLCNSCLSKISFLSTHVACRKKQCGSP